MHYTAGLGAVGSFAGARSLPGDGVLTTLARLLLDCAGALFGLYLLLAVGLAVYGAVARRRARTTAADAIVPRPRPGGSRTASGRSR